MPYPGYWWKESPYDVLERISLCDPFIPRMGATCTNCGSTNTHKVEVTDKGVVVKTYFECNDCGHVW